MSASGPDPGHDPTSPLWRAAQVFRLLSFGYAAGFQIASYDELERPGPSWLLFAALTAASALFAIAYLRGFGRRRVWVAAEFAVVALLILATRLVASPAWIADNQSLPTTLWATNATISAAVLAGPLSGMLTGVAVIAVYAAMKGYVSFNLARNATLVIELAVGLAVGLAAQTARTAHAELARAVRLSAAVAERERLARQVHDGVLQVLALVAKRGREMGGAGAELATLAGEQENALRRLISTADVLTAPDTTEVDIAAVLGGRAGDRVVVSVPGHPVLLDAHTVAELDAAVVNVLDNVRAHAGPGATAYVLVEDLGETVTISVRDDGVGIAPGRLRQAVADGRLGVEQSIVGRLRALSGTALLNTEPGAGTEWELTVPREGAHD